MPRLRDRILRGTQAVLQATKQKSGGNTDSAISAAYAQNTLKHTICESPHTTIKDQESRVVPKE